MLNVEAEVQERLLRLFCWNDLSNLFVYIFPTLEFHDGAFFFLLSGLTAQPIPS